MIILKFIFNIKMKSITYDNFFKVLTGCFLLSLTIDSNAEEAFSSDVESGETKSTPLGVRQQSIKRMVAELENQFTDLAKLIQEENPEQATKLVDAFKTSKDLLLEKRMDDITKLLDLSKLDSANEEQKKTIDDIKGLIEFLLKDDSEKDRIKKEVEKLKRWKAEIESLIQDESELKDESELRAEKDKVLEELDRNIAELKKLIDKQKNIKDATEKESVNGIESLDKIADDQNQLRKDTEKLQDLLSKEGENSNSDKDEESDESEPSDLIKDAIDDQKIAEKKLGEGKGKLAADAESKAIDNMQKALNDLEKERNRVAGIDPEDLEGLKEGQKETADKAAQLSQNIDEENKSDEDSNQQKDPLKEGQEKAQDAIDSAKEKMDSASGQLAQGKPGQAAQQQKDAIEDLNRARDEIDKQLDELQQQEKMEALVQLEQMFSEMLEKQRQGSSKVLVLDEKRKIQDGRLKRADRIELRSVEILERKLSEKSEEAVNLLNDEGSSVVVRNVVEGMQNDLLAIADMVDGNETGVFVQRSQKEVELTLQELIDAVKIAQKMEEQKQDQQNQQQNQQNQQNQQQNLLPPSAELKLLRLTQLRINRRTVDFEMQLNNEKVKNDVLKRQVNEVTILQKKVTESARELAARGQQPLESEID